MVLYKPAGKGKLLKIKGILFDLGGTLCTQVMDESKRQSIIVKEIKNAFVQIGYPLPDSFSERLNDISWQAWKDDMGHPQREYPLVDFLHYLLGETSIPEEQRVDLVSKIEGIIYKYNLRFTVLKPTVKTALEKLRLKNYQLGVVSNTPFSCDHIVDVLKNLAIFDLFKFELTSSMVGYVKPHELIFKQALKQINLKTEETIFVGNDPKEDIEGARAVGLSTIQVVDDGSVPSPAADFAVSKLINVLFLLENYKC